MNCPACDNPVSTTSAFCNACGRALTGTPRPVAPPVPSMAQPIRTSGMAIAGFVLAFFCGLLGLIFSFMAKSEIDGSDGTVGGAGLATAGIVISFLNMLFGFVYAAGGS